MTYYILLLAALAAALAGCLVLAIRLRAGQRDGGEAAARLETSTTTEKSALRQLRLNSHNLRAIGMTLQGHAEHLGTGGAPDVAAIGHAAVGVLDIADYMHEWAEHAESTHVLNEEVLLLRGALDEAISTVTLALRPGRRSWRVDPDVLAMRLRADRRALRHVLTRALSVAARASGHDGSIEIHLEGAELADAKRGSALVIEEQPGPDGRGAPAVGGGSPDLRLTLARTLMEAHGGRLDAEQRDGLTLHLVFPVERIVKTADAPREAANLEVAHRANDDRVHGSSVS